MAGEAKTSKFGLGSATVMLGTMANFLDLAVADSIGLAKNVMTKTTPGFTTLTQGVYNDEVASVKTSNEVMIEGEMYEYTLRNLTYAASLDGSGIAQPGAATTTTSLVASSTAATVIPVTSAAGFAIGGWMVIHVDGTDQVFARKVTAIASLNITVERGLPVSLPSGATVRALSVAQGIGVGSNQDQPYLSCKINGQLADGTWVQQYYPKVRVLSGLSLGFKTGEFDNMPLQIKPYMPVATDPCFAWLTNPDGSIVRGRILTY